MPEKRNESELFFDQYLTERGYTFESQPGIPPGKTKKLEDRVSFDGADVYFEVKEFDEGDTLLDGAFDPYKRIYTKLKDSWAQLNDYREYSCSVVLYNGGAAPVYLEPEFVLGAMLGTLSYVTGEDGNVIQKFFNDPKNTGFKTGRMIDYEKMEPRYTQFSSVIVLEKFPIGQVKFSSLYDEREQHREKGSSTVENAVDTFKYIQTLTAGGFNLEETVLRVVVYENPYASIPLPQGLFQGPYDERWGEIETGKVGQLFAGAKLLELEASLRSYNKSPLVRAGILKDK